LGDEGGAPVRRRRGGQAVEEVHDRVAPPVGSVVGREVDRHGQAPLQRVRRERRVDDGRLRAAGAGGGGGGGDRRDEHGEKRSYTHQVRLAARTIPACAS